MCSEAEARLGHCLYVGFTTINEVYGFICVRFKQLYGVRTRYDMMGQTSLRPSRTRTPRTGSPPLPPSCPAGHLRAALRRPQTSSAGASVTFLCCPDLREPLGARSSIPNQTLGWSFDIPKKPSDRVGRASPHCLLAPGDVSAFVDRIAHTRAVEKI